MGQIKIINTDKTTVLLHDYDSKSDKVQKHQTTKTLHQNVKISIPSYKTIRYNLPTKSLNPSLKSTTRAKFSLPNHYIQYISAPDPGRVSFDDFYDLKKDDIDWLIRQLSVSSVNENEVNIVMNKKNIARNNNISGNALMDMISKKHTLATRQYQTKCIRINAINKQKENSIL